MPKKKKKKSKKEGDIQVDVFNFIDIVEEKPKKKPFVVKTKRKVFKNLRIGDVWVEKEYIGLVDVINRFWTVTRRYRTWFHNHLVIEMERPLTWDGATVKKKFMYGDKKFFRVLDKFR
jgi:hypothetical protein